MQALLTLSSYGFVTLYTSCEEDIHSLSVVTVSTTNVVVVS